MARSRQIRMDRGDTLGGTTPLIVMDKELGSPFVSGEYRRRRRKDRGGGRGIWQWMLALMLLIAVAAVLGLGYERVSSLFQGNGAAPVETQTQP